MVTRIGIHPSVSGEDPPERLAAALNERGITAAPIDDDPSALHDYDAVITTQHRDAFLNNGIQWVHLNSAGTDHVPTDRYADAGVILTNSTGIHTTAVGEHVLGFLLFFAHAFDEFVANEHMRTWSHPDREAKFTLAGETVLVVGLGGLGSGVAALADAAGARVIGVRRSGAEAPHTDAVYPPAELSTVLPDARFVVLTVPLTAETRHLIGARELARMRKDAYLVNVGRGALLDEDALITALREGEIAGAGLDVFEEEPLPESSPLWAMDNVFVSPHRAGMFRDHYVAVAAQAVEIADQLNDGDGDPRNRVV